ncbi:MAG TPA: pentapeptide repeat-containing protein [Methylocella sp.]|jgi:uncharacterized protein YjbI with pentapeptide repeats
MSDEETVTADRIEKFAEQAHDLEAARGSVGEAASVTTGLWLSYLFVLVYIAIAAGAVTHKDLFLENPVKLPFVSDVPLPLVAFFVLAPIVFIVSHAYTLVHFVMLAAKVGVYNEELHTQLGHAEETKEYLRWQLPSNIFVQILAGPAHLRLGTLGFLSKRIAWVSLVIGPIFLLLLIQVQFLPFHSEGITWLHRFFIALDVVLLWALWPAVVDGGIGMKQVRGWRQIWLVLGGCAAIGLSVTAATFPGERMEEWIGRRPTLPPFVAAVLGQRDGNDLSNSKDQPAWTSVHDLLFNGPYDARKQNRTSLFSNTLVLPGFNALAVGKIDDSKLGPFEYSFTRKDGHFEGAIFEGADLRKINLENAHLQGASLLQAKLQGAQFYNANLNGAKLNQAKLQGASLDSAQLEGVELTGAALQGAWALNADLKGAFLKEAQLQGAGLNGAQLQGAELDGAQLSGASLDGAFLWRAGLNVKSADALRAQGVMWDPFWKETTQASQSKPWTGEAFIDLKNTIERDVPAGETRDEILKRVELLDPGEAFLGTAHVPDWRKKFAAAAALDPEKYKQALVTQLKALVCSGDADAPYVVRGLTAYDRIKDTGTEAPHLVEGILSPDCPVETALTEADKAALKQLARKSQLGDR